MLEAVVAVVLGLAGLFFGGELLVRGASRLAFRLGISPLIIGLTVVAFGTSMPELVVSLNAAFEGTSDISIGNVIGSNIFNVGAILGLAALISPLVIHQVMIRREIPFLITVSVLVLGLSLDGEIGTLDGILLFAGIILFTVFLILASRQEQPNKSENEHLAEFEGVTGEIAIPLELARVLLGIVVLVVGARLTVDGAVTIARSIGISELVIGLTLVAAGTSLPELATSVIASVRGENDISVGNIVGSNVFNLLCILGATSIIRPITVAPEVLRFDYLVMIAFALLLIPFAWNRTLGRVGAAVLLTGFSAYLLWTLFGAT